MGEREERNKSLVRRFGAALNDRRTDLLDDLVAPGVVRYCQSTPGVDIRGLDALKRFLEDDWAGVPDGRATARFLVAEGDLVAFYSTYVGTHTGQWGPLAPSGKRVEFDFSGVFRIEDDRIAEMWVLWDNLAVLAQVGPEARPADA